MLKMYTRYLLSLVSLCYNLYKLTFKSDGEEIWKYPSFSKVMDSMAEICRKISEVRISQVKPSNCFRRLQKLVLPFILDTNLSSLIIWNLQSYPTTVLNERSWQFRWWGQNILRPPPTYFQRGQDPQPPQDLHPWLRTRVVLPVWTDRSICQSLRHPRRQFNLTIQFQSLTIYGEEEEEEKKL